MHVCVHESGLPCVEALASTVTSILGVPAASLWCVCVCACVRVHACACACVRVRVRVRVRVLCARACAYVSVRAWAWGWVQPIPTGFLQNFCAQQVISSPLACAHEHTAAAAACDIGRGILGVLGLGPVLAGFWVP
jgi:hypothetical protein